MSTMAPDLPTAVRGEVSPAVEAGIYADEEVFVADAVRTLLAARPDVRGLPPAGCMSDIKEGTMAPTTDILIPVEELAQFCRRNDINYLALFGSASRGELRPDSDVDLLVEFAPEARVGFLALARMQRELSDLFQRSVDLVPRSGLKPAIRESVLQSARVLYAA